MLVELVFRGINFQLFLVSLIQLIENHFSFLYKLLMNLFKQFLIVGHQLLYNLKILNQLKNPGIKAFYDLLKLDTEIGSYHLGYVIGPRINAAGRMDDARKVVQLFIENDEVAAKKLAEELQSDNADRKITDQAITEEALSLLLQLESKGKKKSVLPCSVFHALSKFHIRRNFILNSESTH
jgi:single-stranded DNA-specific DHH superfamily exonuclease